MVSLACNPSMLETEAGQLLYVSRQLGCIVKSYLKEPQNKFKEDIVQSASYSLKKDKHVILGMAWLGINRVQ